MRVNSNRGSVNIDAVHLDHRGGMVVDAETGLVNIGPKETRKRLLIGTVLVAAGVVLAVIFSHAGVGRGWYGALFLPFWAGSLALFQARKKT